MTAPTSLWDLSTTPGSNTSVQGNSVAENCAPSGINDAIRALAAMNKGALVAVSSAGTDTYTATLAPAPDALTTGMGVYIKFGNANLLTNSTLAINGLTAKTIKKNGATAIAPGDIPAGHMGALYYDGTNWILQNPAWQAVVPLTSSMGANLALASQSVFVDGPTIAQGTAGTWYAAGCITFGVTSGAANEACFAKLWDGTTVIAAARQTLVAGNSASIHLSGYIASPANNLRISLKNTTSTTGQFEFNGSGTSKDCTISAFRIA